MTTIQIRALNPDNEREVKALIKLFEQSTEVLTVPIPLCSRSFWQDSIGKRFVSLGAYHNDTLLAHLAVRAGNHGSHSMELVLPSFHPQAFEDIEKITSAYENIMQRLSQRQGWHQLYCVAPFTLSSASIAIAQAIGLQECALLVLSKEEGYRFCCKNFPENVKNKRKRLKVPLPLPVETCKLLSTIQPDLRRAGMTFTPLQSQASAQKMNLEKKNCIRLGQSSLHIPVLEVLHDTAHPRYAFIEPDDKIVALPALVKNAPSVLLSLKEKGFVCCGLIPTSGNSPYLVFNRSAAVFSDDVTHITAKGEELMTIIQQQFALQNNGSMAHTTPPFPFSNNEPIIDKVVTF